MLTKTYSTHKNSLKCYRYLGSQAMLGIMLLLVHFDLGWIVLG